MKIALAGNPNSGKTTLFNELTQLNQKIGNWPGVTVEKKEGKYFKDKSIEIIDLPGIYSLSPISEDERVANNFLKKENPDVIINVIDSTNLERSLALTLQLLETDISVVLALNMEDELAHNGLILNVTNIEKELSVPAVSVSARKKLHLDILIEKAKQISAAKRTAFKAGGKTEEEKAEFRHNYIISRINLFRTKTESKAQKCTDRIDKIVLNKWLAFPIFALAIWLMYFVSIQIVGEYGTSAMEWLFCDVIGEGLSVWLKNIGAAPWVVSLAVEGIVEGVGTVLSFVPQILMLFIFITFLEAVGYMARVAVIMDRLFRKLGLSGKSFIPMIIGTGCTVPAILSTKTIEDEAERRATIMLAPFVPCSAKVPVFALIAGALFPYNSFVAPSMYFMGILMVIIGGLILKTGRKNNTNRSSFVMELPHYRLPKFKNTATEVWNKIKDFIVRAGTVILVASIILWFLSHSNWAFETVKIEDSIISFIGAALSWIFTPLGFGTTAAVVAILTGMMTKELVITVFAVLLVGETDSSLNTALAAAFTPQAAYAFMTLLLLSPPCVAAMAAIRRELGSSKLMFAAIGFQCAMAYTVALIINQAGNLWQSDRTLCISLMTVAAVVAIIAISVYNVIRRKRTGAACGKCSGCRGCANASACSFKNDKTQN